MTARPHLPSDPWPDAASCPQCAASKPTPHYPEPVLATCPHGDRVLVTPGDVGKACWRDGKPLVGVTG